MNLNKKKGFTLIELLVVIAIIALLMMVSFVPYAHYQKKAKLRLAGREISQSFYNAKNMAVSGIKEFTDVSTNESKNKAIGLYMDTTPGKNDSIIYFSYPYDIEEDNINLPIDSIFKTYQLQDGIRINDLSGYKDLLFFFDAIDGNLKIFTFSQNGVRNTVDDNQISITYSYMDSSSPSLQKRLIYFRNTNIIDYE